MFAIASHLQLLVRHFICLLSHVPYCLWLHLQVCLRLCLSFCPLEASRHCSPEGIGNAASEPFLHLSCLPVCLSLFWFIVFTLVPLLYILTQLHEGIPHPKNLLTLPLTLRSFVFLTFASRLQFLVQKLQQRLITSVNNAAINTSPFAPLAYLAVSLPLRFLWFCLPLFLPLYSLPKAYLYFSPWRDTRVCFYTHRAAQSSFFRVWGLS